MTVSSPLDRITQDVEEFAPAIIGLGIRNIDSGSSVEAMPESQTWGAGNPVSTSFYLPMIKGVVDAIRLAAGYDTPIIAGGSGFSAMPEQILRYLELDYGVVGTGEIPLGQFVRAYPDAERIGQIPGLLRREGANYVGNRQVQYAMPLLEMDNFVRDHDFDFFFSTAWGLPIRTRRGCNMGCIYCVEPLTDGRKVRYREVHRVRDEIRLNRQQRDFHTVYFVDSEFNVPDESYSSKLCDALIESGLSAELQFRTQCTIKPFSEQFAQKLKHANFTLIGFTADSVADEVLARSGKNFRYQDICRVVDIAEKLELNIVISLLFGLPGETQQTIEASLDFILSHPQVFFEIGVGARVYPGTELARRISRGQLLGHRYGVTDGDFLYPNCYCTPIPPRKLLLHLERTLHDCNNATLVWHKGMNEAQLDFHIHRNLSGFYMDTGMVDESLEQYNRMAQVQDDPETRLYLCRRLLELGQFDLIRKLDLGSESLGENSSRS
jgi:hypothetical protein